jgi:HSP20 family protein
MNALTHFNRFDNIFDLFFNKSEIEKQSRTISPSLNAKETEKEILLSFELPGFAKEDIDIHLEKDQLIISAKHQEEKEENNDKWLRKEISSGHYSRRVTLPDNINADKISAEANNGILTVSLPKALKKDTVKKIRINE